MSIDDIPATRPSRAVYPPPVPTGFVDPGGKSAVEKAARTQQAVSDLYTDWRAAHSPDIDPDLLRDNAGAFQVSDAALQLPEVLKPAKAESEDATANVNTLVKRTRVPNDVASQIAAQRYWDRTRRTLDAIRDPAKVLAAAQDLVANADDDAVPVVAEELSDYLTSRGIPAGWLPNVLATRIPGLPEAQADAITKARQLAILQANHAALTNAIEKDTPAPPLLDPMNVDATPYVE